MNVLRNALHALAAVPYDDLNAHYKLTGCQVCWAELLRRGAGIQVGEGRKPWDGRNERKPRHPTHPTTRTPEPALVEPGGRNQ